MKRDQLLKQLGYSDEFLSIIQSKATNQKYFENNDLSDKVTIDGRNDSTSIIISEDNYHSDLTNSYIV
jgi:hypothetical protein